MTSRTLYSKVKWRFWCTWVELGHPSPNKYGIFNERIRYLRQVSFKIKYIFYSFYRWRECSVFSLLFSVEHRALQFELWKRHSANSIGSIDAWWICRMFRVRCVRCTHVHQAPCACSTSIAAHIVYPWAWTLTLSLRVCALCAPNSIKCSSAHTPHIAVHRWTWNAPLTILLWFIHLYILVLWYEGACARYVDRYFASFFLRKEK